MNKYLTTTGPQNSNNKKLITIGVIIVLAVAFGFFLFKISPAEQQALQPDDFDYSQVNNKNEPRGLQATDQVFGSRTAKNVFIAYEDYQCPACAAYSQILKQVPTAFPDTALVYRYYPLTQIHRNAVTAAYAAEAAGAQGKYWEMHDALYADQQNWQASSNPVDRFAELARQIGVGNIEQFTSDITSKKFKDRIQTDLVEALSLKLQGTPSFYFNGHKIEPGDLEGMKKQAEQWMVK